MKETVRKKVRFPIPKEVNKNIMFSPSLTHCNDKWVYDQSRASDKISLLQSCLWELLDQPLYCLVSWNEVWEVEESNTWETGNGCLWIASNARNWLYQERIFKFVPRWDRHIRGLWEVLKYSVVNNNLLVKRVCRLRTKQQKRKTFLAKCVKINSVYKFESTIDDDLHSVQITVTILNNFKCIANKP
jgi:hypothetical protein